MFSCRNDYSSEDLKVHRHFLIYFVSLKSLSVVLLDLNLEF